MTKNNHSPFITLAIALFCIFLLPSLGKHGLFFDGIIYGVLSENLANGVGSFWAPFYTKFFSPVFYGHPPLAFNIESISFHIFGNYHWVERLHSLFLAILTAFGIGLVWRTALPKFKKYFWLPLIFWIIIPVVTWSFKSNMLENTVVCFSIFSVYFMHKALKTKELNLQWIFLSALFLLGAFLSKGIATLFPLAAFGCYALVNFNFSKKIILSQILLVFCWIFLAYSLITLFPEAKTRLYETISVQLNSTQKSVTKDSRFFIIGKLFSELLIGLILTIGILIWKFVKEKSYFAAEKDTLKMSAFWLLIGFSGILPIMLSTKQSGFYIVPAAMFFALGFAAAIVSAIHPMIEKSFNQGWLKYIGMISLSVITLSLSLMINNWNTYDRDQGLIEDIQKIGKVVELDEMTMQQDIEPKWALAGYFMRYEKISLEETNQLTYYVGRKGVDQPKDYKKVDLDLEELILFKKINEGLE